MVIRIVRFVLAAMFAAHLAFQPAAAAELRPSGGWRVDYGEAQCIALRDLSDGDSTFLFGIRPSFGGSTYEIMLSKKGPAPSLGEESTGSIDFGQGGTKVEQMTYRSKESGLAITRLRIPDSAVMQMKAANSIELAAFGKRHRIATGPLAKLVVALETCVDDLEKYWNYGATHAVPARPERDVRTVFSGDDYPQEAFSRGGQGQSQYAVLIDVTGRIAGCDLIKASGIPSLDFMGCQVITKRAKFENARDSAGKPVRDTYITPPVRWVLQK